MATIIPNGVIIAAAALSTAVENTAQIRYIRASICNRDTVAHTYHVDVGAHRVKSSMSLAANEDRTVGPHALTAGESFTVTKVEIDTTNPTHVRFTGEY